MSPVLEKLVRPKSTRMFSSTLYSRFAPPVARNVNKLEAKRSRKVPLSSQQPRFHLCRRGLIYWTRFLCFSCFGNVFIKSSKMNPDCCFFFCIYTLLNNGLHQSAPLISLLYHPPSLPTVSPLLLQAFVLKGVKFLLCILISEKLSPSTFSLNS